MFKEQKRDQVKGDVVYGKSILQKCGRNKQGLDHREPVGHSKVIGIYERESDSYFKNIILGAVWKVDWEELEVENEDGSMETN